MNFIVPIWAQGQGEWRDKLQIQPSPGHTHLKTVKGATQTCIGAEEGGGSEGGGGGFGAGGGGLLLPFFFVLMRVWGHTQWKAGAARHMQHNTAKGQ